MAIIGIFLCIVLFIVLQFAKSNMNEAEKSARKSDGRATKLRN